MTRKVIITCLGALAVFLAMFSLLLAFSAQGVPSSPQHVGAQQEVHAFPVTELEEPLAVDPLGVTLLDPTKLLTSRDRERLVVRKNLVERIATGVWKIGSRKGGGVWYECGDPMGRAIAEPRAREWAERIVELAEQYGQNQWALLGVAAKESGLDVCALGPWPRKWAYEHGVMKPRRRCLSHRREDIMATMTHPKGVERWSTIGVDAAPLHQLWRCNANGMCRTKFGITDLPPIPLAEVFSLGKGFEYNVIQLRDYAVMYRTERPWQYWRGRRSIAYDRDVVKWARIGGASERDLEPVGGE